MKALTLWQPWASLIAEGVKLIETRSWPAPASLIGDIIAIHAAKSMPRALREIAYSDPIGRALNDRGIFLGGDCASLPLGAVVATARLTACVPMAAWRDEPRGGTWGYAVLSPEHGWHERQISLRENDCLAPPLLHDDVDVSDQLPFGDFAPGRWAWLLDDIEKLPEPVPAKGRQKLWEWTP